MRKKVVGHQKKGNPYYNVAKYLAELSSTVGKKVELVSNELRQLAKEISKQSVEGTAWFLLTAYTKKREERDKLMNEWLSKKEPELEDMKYSQPNYIVKK